MIYSKKRSKATPGDHRGDGSRTTGEKNTMDFGRNEQNSTWGSMSYELKTRALYLRQKQTLDLFLERGAISQAQHDKSLHDLTVKMGMAVS